MKKIILLLFFITLSITASAQSSKWSSLSYTYSKGPVSPPYQYSYTILIDRFGNSSLNYTKSDVTKEYPFKIGKKGLKKLNYALKKSKVFTVSPEDMKSENNLIGGPEKTLVIVKNQSPLLDQMPQSITVPSQVNEIYSENINNLYDEIENLVPSDVWNHATGEW